MRSHFYGILLICCCLVVKNSNGEKRKQKDASDEDPETLKYDKNERSVRKKNYGECSAKKCPDSDTKDTLVKNKSDDEIHNNNRRNKMDKDVKYDTLNKANKFARTATVDSGKRKNGKKNKESDEKSCGIDSTEDECDSSEEYDQKKIRGKIKYSIKFQHEKQKKPSKVDNSILRLHKNRGADRNAHDYDSSEEDDNPFPKRIRFDEDEDD